RFARALQSALSPPPSTADRTSMTSCRTAPHGRLVEHPVVDGRGFAALRLAVALHRDGQLGPTLDPVAYRAASKTARSGAASTGSPSIPVPAPPSEPTGELATVMDIVARAQSGDADAFGELYDRYVDVVYRYI